MPQPTLISGVAGTVHSEAYQGPTVGEQMVQMAQAFAKVKIAQQEQALQKLNTMLSNVDKLPIDEKAIRKVAKQAGLPLADNDTISAIAKAGQTSSQPGQQPQGSTDATAKGMSSIAGTEIKPTDIKKPAQPDAAVAAAQQKWQQNMTPEQGANHVFDTWVARSRQLADAKFKDEKAKVEYSTQLTALKTAAMAGDAKAAGQLMAAGEVPFNISQLAWQQASPEQRAKVYELAMGHETDAQQKERETTIFNSLLQHGRVNAADAMSIAHSIANGQPLSAEQQKRMGQPSFKELADEASFMEKAYELGVPADKIQGVAAAAMLTGSLVTALPKGLQPIFQKELDLRNRQLGIEGGRLGVERERTEIAKRQVSIAEAREKRLGEEAKQKREATTYRLELMRINGQNKAELDALRTYAKMKKDGTSLSESDNKKLQMLKDKLEIPEGYFEFISGQHGVTLPSGSPIADELE